MANNNNLLVAKFGLFPSVRLNILNVGAAGSGRSTFTRDLLSLYATQVAQDSDGFRAKGDDFAVDSKWIMESATCKSLITVYDAPEFGDVDNRVRYALL
jgi:septin family protein